MGLPHFDHAGLAALCGSGDPVALPTIALGLFGAALVGGFAHCAPMCGPFVLMQVADQEPGALTLQRLARSTLPFYQFGRLTTYVVLGGLAGGLGASAAALAPFHWVAAALLGLAAVAFLLRGLGGALKFLPLSRPGVLEGWFAHLLARLAGPLLRRRGAGAAGYPLGLVLGLLPCGFLYAALLAAAASGGAVAGALAMAAFALGTIPALAVVGVAGTTLLRRWRMVAQNIATGIFLLNAATLGTLALRLAG
jgi:sulfite exporter TauE/SafE